jgi:type IV pilus assembly protein PilW
MRAPARPSGHRERGVGIVEVMVGVVVGLVGMLALFQVATLAESYRRAATSGGSAQMAGQLAMAAIERDVRTAGYGLSAVSMFGCKVLGQRRGATVGTRPTFEFTLQPAEVVDGRGGADELRVLYGGSSRLSGAVDYTSVDATKTALPNRAGFRASDLYVAQDSAKNCTVLQVGAGFDPATSLPALEIPNGGVYFMRVAPGKTFGAGGTLMNLGPPERANANTWFVRAGQLVVRNEITGIEAAVADGVVDFQVEYGYDADGNMLVTDAEWRNGQLEKEQVTTRVPTWASARAESQFSARNVDGTAGTLGASATVVPDPNDWRHYRYRVYELAIPLRNMLWRVTS